MIPQTACEIHLWALMSPYECCLYYAWCFGFLEFPSDTWAITTALEIFNIKIFSTLLWSISPLCPEFLSHPKFQCQISLSWIQKITVHINDRMQMIRCSWRNTALSLSGRACNLNCSNEGHLMEVLGLNRLEWFPISIPKHSSESCWLKLVLRLPFKWNTLKCFNSFHS